LTLLSPQYGAQRLVLAAAGEKKACKRESAKAKKKAKKRAEPQPSAHPRKMASHYSFPKGHMPCPENALLGGDSGLKP
jgi:hypothetical protein